MLSVPDRVMPPLLPDFTYTDRYSITGAVTAKNGALDKMADDVLDGQMRFLNVLRVVARNADGNICPL
jgi:hypothetical protein